MPTSRLLTAQPPAGPTAGSQPTGLSAGIPLTPAPPPLPGESAAWYARFLLYLHLPSYGRSLLAVYNAERAQARGLAPRAIVSPGWRSAFQRHQWQARTREWELLEAQRLGQVLAREREAWRRQEMSMARQLLVKGQEGMAVPLGEVLGGPADEGDGGFEECTLKADPQAVRVGVQCLVESSTLARRALELPTVTTKVNVSQLTDAELLRLLNLAAPDSFTAGSAPAGPDPDGD